MLGAVFRAATCARLDRLRCMVPPGVPCISYNRSVLILCTILYACKICVASLKVRCPDSRTLNRWYPPLRVRVPPPCLAGELDSVDPKCISHVVHTETIPKRYGEPLLRLMQWLKSTKPTRGGTPGGTMHGIKDS